MTEKHRYKLSQAFATAMVDAINCYVREVLRAKGCISQEGFEQHGNEEYLQAKYAIAREWGIRWAAFLNGCEIVPEEETQSALGASPESTPSPPDR